MRRTREEALAKLAGRGAVWSRDLAAVPMKVRMGGKKIIREDHFVVGQDGGREVWVRFDP